MPTRIQCSACALMDRLSAVPATRRFSCIRSEILTIPIDNLYVKRIRSIYISYVLCDQGYAAGSSSTFTTNNLGQAMKRNHRIAAALAIPFASAAFAQQIGEVDTAFKLIGPDHKIVVEAFDDPKVAGVTCYVSRSKAGGVTGALGLATEKSESSIACRQVGPISSTVPIPKSEEVFSESRSFLFKKLRIVRMVDPARQ